MGRIEANIAAQSRLREIEVVIDLFASFGIAVFPGPFGEKGSRVKDWPRAGVKGAREIALRELRKRPINIVLRTGPELGAIDIDGKGGVNPSAALERLLAILPTGVADYRSARGFGILFRPKHQLGNGLLPSYGAELFTDGHLINVPPGRHPSGIDYEWIIPPGDVLPIVDLEALGLLPEGAPEADPRVRRRSNLRPAPEAIQSEFERLMASVGIRPHRAKQELHRCPWHDDHDASLSVNWEGAVFNDFGGCARGGVTELRRIMNDPKGRTA